MVSCFNEAAMSISLSSCSSYSKSACVSPNITLSRQNSVASLYRIILSTQKQLFITVTWCKNNSSQGFSLSFGKSFNLSTNSLLFKKKKGSKVYESDNSEIEVVWDLSDAKYVNGAEPEDGFYVFVLVDSEVALILGDEQALHKRFKSPDFSAKASLISRREEHSSGHTHYSTKAQLCNAGIKHRISIRFTEENEGLKNPGLSVCVDEKTVVCVRRLQWNFRGNQTIFVDGLLVDLFWNVHDLLFRPVNGYAVFMFRTRNGVDGRFRLWMEEKVVKTEEESVEFSLLIFSSKIS